MEITYDLVEPLIANRQSEGNKMFCEFYLPDSEETIMSEALIRRSRSVKGQVTRVVKRNMTNQLRRVVMRTARQALGGGFLGRTGTMAISSATRESSRGFTQGFSEEEKRTAILEAFNKVSEHFYFDEENYMWISPPQNVQIAAVTQKSSKRLSPFEKQLKDNPMQDSFEREVLARLLVEMANANGDISEEEIIFIDSFMDPSLGTVDDLLQMDAVSEIECEEVNPKSRETIFMLAWMVALADMDLDPDERDLLMEYKRMFGLPENRADELIKMAKYFALEQVITAGTGRSELYEKAERIELSQEDAERCRIQMKRRG